MATSHACRRTTTFAIGSFTTNENRPDFRGDGITLARQSGLNVTKTLILPPASVGHNPSYIAQSASSLLTCNSIKSGAITHISATNSPPFLSVSSVSIPDQQPSHLSVLRRGNGRAIVVAVNAFGGSVNTFLKKGHTISALHSYKVPASNASMVRSPFLTKRQAEPHPHMALPYGNGKGVIVPDLGADMVFFMQVSWRGRLSLRQSIELQPGDGPRHAVVHKRSGTVYVINELSQTIVVLQQKSPSHKFCATTRHKLLDGPARNGTASAIRISSDERFLYASVRLDTKEERKDGRIVVFSLREDGRVSHKVCEVSSGGVHPRDFYVVGAMLVQGRCRSYLVVANRDSDEIAFLPRDSHSGTVGSTEFRFQTRTPTSVLPLWVHRVVSGNVFLWDWMEYTSVWRATDRGMHWPIICA